MIKYLKDKRELKACYDAVFSSEAGQRVLSDLLRNCQLTSRSMTMDRDALLFREGQRSVGIRLINTLNLKDEDIENLLKEKEDERIVDEAIGYGSA